MNSAAIVQDDKVHLKVLTQTAVRTFRKCPRLYNFLYDQLYRPIEVSEPLEFGDIWHQIREVWWHSNKGAARLDAAIEKLSEIKVNPDFELDDFILAKLIVMLRGYHERWVDYVDNLKIVGVELPFSISMVNPRSGRESRTYVIEGKLDAVVEDENGDLWVVEEKTAGEDLKPESPYWRRLEIDPQCSIYFNAVHELFGRKPKGILYFVNVKPQYRQLKKTENIKYKKDGSGPYANQRLVDESSNEYAVRVSNAIAENPERFYQMVHVARLERDIVESQIDVWDTAKAIREAELSKVWLRNPDSCIHPFGSTCSFLPVCANRASLEDPAYYRKAEAAHEELIDTENRAT